MKVGVERKDETGRPVLDLVPLRRPITIEDLLLHTSGITYGFYGEGLVKVAYDGIYLGDFDNAGFAERIAKVPLAEQPRTLWDYGHSTDVLGRVIEVVSGQSLYQFEKSQLFDPLGMTLDQIFSDRSGRARPLRPAAAQRPPCRAKFARHHAMGIRRRRTGFQHRRHGALRPDAAQWRHAGRQDLSRGENICRHDHRPYRARIRRRPQLFYYPGDGFGFGYGFGVRTDPGNAVPPPPGSPGEFKWDGATGAYIVVDRAEDMFFVLLLNAPSGRWHVEVTVKNHLRRLREVNEQPHELEPKPC